ncbi:MAG: hypothetical protein IJ515_01880 [Clostridia bacterium]|nr:hypothetical protein [Clostridia bacterium]
MLIRFFRGENKRITVTTLVMAAICSGLGVLLHYTFEWSGGNFFVGLFSAVNESVWEHLKLLFVPYAFLMIIEYAIYGKDRRNFFCAKFIGVILGMFSIAMNYYFYTGALGMQNPTWNIIFYFIGVLTAYLFAWWRMVSRRRKGNGLLESLAILGFGAVCTAFFVFTLYPPTLPIFMDPVTYTYGIPR